MNDLVLIPKEPNQQIIQEYLKDKVLPAMIGSREAAIKAFTKDYNTVVNAAMAVVVDVPILTRKQLQEIILSNDGNAMEVIEDILNKEVINTILTITRGNQTTAASRLGINRGTLRTRISKIRKSNSLYDLPI